MEKKKIKTGFPIRRYLLLGVYALVVAATAMTGGTLGKYVFEREQDPLYIADAFYFESNLLTEAATTAGIPTYTYANGTSSITVELYNYTDSLRYSEGDVKYEVTLTDENGASVIDASGNTVEAITGIIETEAANTEAVTFSNLNAGTYLVTATSTDDYAKTLKGIFTLQDTVTGVSFSVSGGQSGSGVVKLTVSTSDSSGTVSIGWVAGLAPDSTDPNFASVMSGYSAGSCTVEFQSNSEYTFTFFKANPSAVFDDDRSFSVFFTTQ